MKQGGTETERRHDEESRDFVLLITAPVRNKDLKHEQKLLY